MHRDQSVKVAVANDSFLSTFADNEDLHSVHSARSGQPSGAGAAAQEEEDSIPAELTNYEIAFKLMKAGFPLSLACIAQFSLIAGILAVVGHLGVNQLGGAALALGLINATGFAFAAGLCGGLETVLSHTYGRDPHSKMYGVFAQRMCIILLVTCIPLGIVLTYIDSFLMFLGQPPEVLYYMGIFCRMALFGIPMTMLMQLLQRYYSCQHLTNPLSVSLIVGALVSPFLQVIFIELFGFYGSPIAWGILMLGMVAGLLLYLRYSGIYKQTWAGWDEQAIHNIMPLLKLALPSLGMMLSEWVALEVNSICAGFGTPVELAGFSISAQVFGICWGVPSGVIILTCVFIGNAIGEGKPLLARRIAIVSIVIVLLHAVVDVIVCLSFEYYIPYLFNNSEEVAEVYRKLMYVVLPYHIFDTFQSTVMAILRGCGLQKIGAVIITIAFCVTGVPIGFILFFGMNTGVIGLWIGPFIGVTFVGTPMYLYVLFRYVDWANLKAHTEEVPQVELEILDEKIASSMSDESEDINDDNTNNINNNNKVIAESNSSSNNSRSGSENNTNNNNNINKRSSSAVSRTTVTPITPRSPGDVVSKNPTSTKLEP